MSFGGRSRVAQPTRIPVVVDPVAGAAQGCIDFAFNGSDSVWPSGSFQTVRVPTGVRSAFIECWGAQGAEGFIAGFDNGPGLGGYIACVVPVNPGETLRVYVGQKGRASGASQVFNGGGAGGHQLGNADGSGGGGATDVRRTPYDMGGRLVVAGGGGGGGGWSGVGLTAFGGNGGYLEGLNGGQNISGGDEGKGGTQYAGGAAGATFTGFGTPAQAGTQGVGGDAEQNPTTSSVGSGGGGGGWYGGGGGSTPFCGGGGGSSGFHSTAELFDHANGVNAGNGRARICWVTNVASPVVPTLNANLILHLRSTDGITTDPTAGGVLTAWTDLSMYGNHASAAGTARPLPTRVINGLHVVDFDGTDDVITGTIADIPAHHDGSGEANITVYMVGVVDSPLAASVVWLTLNGGQYFIQWTQDPFHRIVLGADVTITTGVGDGVPVLGSTFFLRANSWGSGDVTAGAIKVNGVNYTSGSTSTGRQAPWGAYAIGGSGGVFANMALAEIRIYDTILLEGSAEDVAVKAEMAAYWGVTT